MIIYQECKRASYYGIIERKINKNMKTSSKYRYLASLIVVSFCITFFTASANALDPNEAATSTEKDAVAPEGSTLLPDKGDLTTADCEAVMRYVNYTPIDEIKGKVAKKENIEATFVDQKTGESGYYPLKYTQVLGCAITTGDVKAWMIPFFIRYILEFIIGLAGLIAVGGIVYGGYLYLFAGLSDDKDKGKSAIKNGILGFVLVLTSWAIVNIVISLITL